MADTGQLQPSKSSANDAMFTLARIAAACALFFLLRLEVAAQDDIAAMRTTIEAQLEAFKTRDAERAFSFASDTIRDKFGSAEYFMAMVRHQYPVLMAPASVAFLKPEFANGATLQPVQLSDEQGQAWLALYSMQMRADGSWRINGCVLKRVQGSST